jgi:HD-like signal output (HDOD) protein
MSRFEILQALLEDVDELPTLPTVLIKINNLLQDPRTSSEEVGHAISSDQALASRVMKLVNSAFYGFPGRINTISHAISLLGFLTVRNIVITASIIGAFDDEDQKQKGLDYKQFWLHCVATASIAKLTAKTCKIQQSEEAFITGLLHGLGKLLLQLYLPDEYAKVFAYLERKPSTLIEAERRILGYDHTHAGTWLATKWNLPKEITEVIQHYQDPFLAKQNTELAVVVNFSHIIARALEQGSGGDPFIPTLRDDVWDYLNMDENTLKVVLQNAKNEIERAAIFMQII